MAAIISHKYGMTNRASFVLQEYRTTAAEDATVKTMYPKARTISIGSQLDEANAQALAQKVLAQNDQPVCFEQDVDGIILPDAFIGGCPTYIPEYEKFRTDGRTMKLVAFTCDLETGITSIRIRG